MTRLLLLDIGRRGLWGNLRVSTLQSSQPDERLISLSPKCHLNGFCEGEHNRMMVEGSDGRRAPYLVHQYLVAATESNLLLVCSTGLFHCLVSATKSHLWLVFDVAQR